MRFSPRVAAACIAFFAVLTGVTFAFEEVNFMTSEDPWHRFLLGVGVSTLIIGLGGVIGRLPRAIGLLSSRGS